MVAEKGIPALNMRAVAGECGVALGSLYNYFPSKEDMLIATVESVWQDIFRAEGGDGAGLPFPEYVGRLFGRVLRSAGEYPNFFGAHSLSFTGESKARARDTMERYFSHLKAEMALALDRDGAVRPDAFSPAFPQSDFLDFVLTNLLSLLLLGSGDCRGLQEILRRVLY